MPRRGADRPLSGCGTCTGAGAYHITATGFTYDPTVGRRWYTGTFAYGYVAKSSSLLISGPGNYRLYADFASDALPFGDAGKTVATSYVSTANVSACESCHGKPYQKHGYREAAGCSNLGDFAACKSCHYDDRAGTDHIWQQMVDDPYCMGHRPWPGHDVSSTPTRRPCHERHAHVARDGVPVSAVDVELQHVPRRQARQWSSPTRTSRRRPARAATRCDGIDAWEGQKYDETRRAPALKELWAKANVTFHEVTDDCTVATRRAASPASSWRTTRVMTR